MESQCHGPRVWIPSVNVLPFDYGQRATVVEGHLDLPKRHFGNPTDGSIEQRVDETQGGRLAEAVRTDDDHNGFARDEPQVVIETPKQSFHLDLVYIQSQNKR